MQLGLSLSSVAEAAEPSAAPGLATEAAFGVPVAAVPVEAKSAGAEAAAGEGSAADAEPVLASEAGAGFAETESGTELESAEGLGVAAGVESDDAAGQVEVAEFGLSAGGAAEAAVGLAGAEPVAGVDPATVADPVPDGG